MVEAASRELVSRSQTPPGAKGIRLEAAGASIDEAGIHYDMVDVALDAEARTAAITLTLPASAGPKTAEAAWEAGSGWWFFKVLRQLDDALLHLRLEYLDIGTITLRVVGDPAVVQATDALLESGKEHWFVREVRLFAKRVLKRLDLTARTTFAVADEGTCFVGTFLEMALSADRIYLLNDADHPVSMGVTVMNGGAYPMSNGLTRLQTRFLGEPSRVDELLAESDLLDAERADELGLATVAPDIIDWEDDLRIALEERASFSPDALTGMEANLRFAGPESMETKIFGRLSAWQNWIFQRPNAVGKRGALQCYGTPNRPELDWIRT
jgi:benzoyl-CoA-dihydrodiol lyase